MTATPGTLVRCREREWVVLPSEDPEAVMLRPIGGSGRETCGVVTSLSDVIGYSLPFERIKPAEFPPPSPGASQDLAAVRLLQEAVRLLLREGATPFRSLGHLSVRPRPYQFVPLLMALRMEAIRLLIADDVGVGKTIEAAPIARELLDRGEIRRIGVLCPPYLCEQWQGELRDKFSIDAVVIRSGTLSRLERRAPPDRSVFEFYPHFVASIDLVKGDRYRPSLVEYCPEFLMVDEVHGAAQPPSSRGRRGRQMRHALLRELASDEKRHLVLLTATPHSGIEESFLSILGSLHHKFRELDLSSLKKEEEEILSRHFVQRRRRDGARWMDVTPFPTRDDGDSECPYHFSGEYRRLYERVYEFARHVVRSAESLSGWKRRMRFWSALALLRCVTSSPAAAVAALRKRVGGDTAYDLSALEEASDDELADTFEPVVYDPLEIESVVDAPPSSVFEAQERDADWRESERRQLVRFAREAQRLHGEHDQKLLKLVEVAAAMLDEGYRPIVWCRYIATADYVAEELQDRLAERSRDVRVVSVTGAVAESERRLKVGEVCQSASRVLVATDCLSEGINLQQHFDAVIHYDLPWNPNRLEQREGRVDRFG